MILPFSRLIIPTTQPALEDTDLDINYSQGDFILGRRDRGTHRLKLSAISVSH